MPQAATEENATRVGRSIVFHGPGIPLELRQWDIPNPGSGEYLLEVVLAGVCGTEPHRLSGEVPAPGRPVCFGHETVGRVVALGHGVTTDYGGTPLAVGDLAYFLSVVPCGQCPACLAEIPLICDHYGETWPIPALGPNAAGFQDYAVVPALAPLYRIPESVDPEAVIAFGCAMPTAITGFRRLGPVPDSVVVLGTGPVGLASTLLAALGGATQIIAVGDPAPRLEIAKRLGATHTIPLTGTTASERRATIFELTGGRGAAAVIEAAGHRSAFPEGFELLGKGGRFLVMGLFSGEATAPIDPIRINNLSLHILGTLGNAPDSLKETIDIAIAHGDRLGFAELVTDRFPLEETEAAIANVASGHGIKTVVLPRP
ncbi:zinc-binding dehydrogenase [Microbacterium sp. BWT-B31]|uniref:zinc-binding dehydrogenase n=1 Tax=Microbacterium sp. BWT-B31 TaxID=3232072 RepID=UPI003527BE8E